jgi:hypothetical protein
VVQVAENATPVLRSASEFVAQFPPLPPPLLLPELLPAPLLLPELLPAPLLLPELLPAPLLLPELLPPAPLLLPLELLPPLELPLLLPLEPPDELDPPLDPPELEASVPPSAGFDAPDPPPHAKTVAKLNADVAPRAHADVQDDACERRVVIHPSTVRGARLMPPVPLVQGPFPTLR